MANNEENVSDCYCCFQIVPEVISYPLVASSKLLLFHTESQCFHLINNLVFSNYERKTKKLGKFPSCF